MLSMNLDDLSLEILYCPHCRVGVEASYSKSNACSHCGAPRILLTSQISSLTPEIDREFSAEFETEPVDSATPPLSNEAETLIYRAQQQLFR
ncbi:MAG: hypothetical protein WEC37_00280 [Anaerolineales bacterium]